MLSIDLDAPPLHLLFEVLSDLNTVLQQPQPPPPGGFHRYCSRVLEGRPCSKIARCEYGSVPDPVIACYFDGGSRIPAPSKLDALFRQLGLLRLFVQVKHFGRVSEIVYRDFSEQIGHGLPMFVESPTGQLTRLHQPGDFDIQESLTELPGATERYMDLAECLRNSTHHYIVVRDGELAFFSLLYRLAQGRDDNDALEELGLVSGGRPTARFGRMMVWLHFQRLLVDHEEHTFISQDFPVKCRADGSGACLSVRSRLIDYFRGFGDYQFRSLARTAWNAGRSEPLASYSEVYRQLHLDRATPEGVTHVVDHIRNFFKDVTADAVDAAARVVSLEAEIRQRAELGPIDHNLLIVNAALQKVTHEASIANILAFANVRGPVPTEGPDLLGRFTGPIQALSISLGVLAIGRQMTPAQTETAASLNRVAGLTCPQWRYLRTWKWRDASVNHWRGGGSGLRPEPQAERLANLGAGALAAYAALKLSPDQTEDPPGREYGINSGLDINRPSLRALVQNYVANEARWRDGAQGDMTRFWHQWVQSVAAWRSHVLFKLVQIKIDREHDYLWFNVFALRNGLEAFLENVHRTTAQLRVQDDTREHQRFLVHLLETDSGLEFNPRFPFSLDGGHSLHSGMHQMLTSFARAGVAVATFTGMASDDAAPTQIRLERSAISEADALARIGWRRSELQLNSSPQWPEGAIELSVEIRGEEAALRPLGDSHPETRLPSKTFVVRCDVDADADATRI